MKHKKIILPILILSILLINPKVNAATVRTSSSTVYPGQSFTASVTLTAAAWNVHSTASGPVSGCVMNDANASDSATNISKTVSTTCYATGVGTITISLSGDYTTEDGANYPLSGTGYVNVVNAPANKPGGGGGNWGGGGNYTPTPETPKSTNNFLKALSVKDCTLSPTFDKNVLRYACSDLTIDNTEILAEAEDSKAKVTGTGNVNLRNGDNNFEVVVTAEDGSTKTYKVLLNKKNIPSTKILSLKIDNNGYAIDDEFLLLGLNKDTKELNIEVDLDSSTAKSTISGNKNLKPGINVITIKVSDTDCKTKEYKVIVLSLIHI